jgi:dipeptidyl aminopeptidase/acylaminoacyl peptidase
MKHTIGVVLLLVTGATHAEPPPISAFARLEQIRGPSISDDGRFVAYISQVKGNRVAVVIDLQAPATPAKAVLSVDQEKDFDMTWCRWANKSRLLCGFQAPMSIPGRTIRTSRMMSVNADGSDVKLLRQDTLNTIALDQDEVLDMTPDNPDSVLVQTFERTQAGGRPEPYPSVFELNVYSGKMKPHTKDHAPIRHFYSDGRGNIRLATGLDGTITTYYARLDGDKEWRKLAQIEAYERGNALVPQSIIPGTNTAYGIGGSGGRNALFKIDLEDKAKPELIFDHALVDVTRSMRTADGNLVGVFYELERPFVYYTDERVGALMQRINKALPGTFNVLTSISRDEKTAVIAARSDTDAGTYYVLNVTTSQLKKLGTAYPELPADQLPRMRSIEYKAADGTLIPGYLTIPNGVRAEKLPLIVLPHGGPIARDTWRFDFLRHFLASRGYAVLQMNFRGSAGYGEKWFHDAFQDWGGVTYSDIADAARWASAQGIADPQRMCIVGWSFGGYSALVGAVRNPDLFKCSASIAGLSDLVELRGDARGVGAKVVQKQIGNDKDKLRAASPVDHAADVQMPVLLIHGTLDAQAPYEQSKDMASALKKAGKNYKFVTIENADHSLVRESERTLLLTELEQFLLAYLGPGSVASN